MKGKNWLFYTVRGGKAKKIENNIVKIHEEEYFKWRRRANLATLIRKLLIYLHIDIDALKWFNTKLVS